MESHEQHPLPSLLDRVATTPPPSFPLLSSSDHFPFSDFDSYDWDRLEHDDTYFRATPNFLNSLGFSSSSSSSQLARHASVASSAPSPTRRSRLSSPSLSPRPFSSRHSTRNSPTPRLGTEPTTEAVDLTGQSTPDDMPPRRVPKRSAPSSQDTRSDKRRKRDASAREESAQNGATEEVDLRDEDEVAVADILQKQREDQIMRQRKEGEERPKLSALQCIICLESPTDLTVTSCGHLFCHACLMPALNTGEPSKSRCPVCRRAVNRVKKSGKAVDFQPLELKLKTRSSSGSSGKGKEREAPRAGAAATSGK